MDQERWKQVDNLLEQLLDLPIEERAPFLTTACSSDNTLRADVEAVLKSYDNSTDFLDKSAIDVLAESRIGATFLHYRIVAALGSGGMGVVYKAEDLRLGRFVALKFLSSAYAADKQALARLQREARLVAALDHPNICTVYDIREHEGEHFIVMQLLEGETLAERVSRGPLGSDEATHFAAAIAAALDSAHRKGIVHRDLKPANIFITSEGHLKVLDFGLAKSTGRPVTQSAAPLAPREPYASHPGMAMGTAAYMSPEQALGRDLDHRTDLFSFGCVLYEMITGHSAFGAPSTAIVFDSILHKSPPSPVALNPGVPAALVKIVAGALEKDRRKRYQSASDMLADLNLLANPTERRRERRARGYLVAGAVVVALMLWINATNDEAIPTEADDQRLTLFLSSQDKIADPSFSADGKTIVFVAERNGQSDIFLSRAAGGGPLQVTNDANAEADPRFSPDGETIIFVRRIAGKDQPEICITPAFSGAITPIVQDAIAPSWSPDGSRIAFVARRPGASFALTVADASGANGRILLESDATYAFIYDPVWSPDGSQLAFVRSMGGITGEIWTVPVAGGPPQRVSNDPSQVFAHNPAFTPDGAGIVHSSNRSGATNLWIMFHDGRKPIQLTSGTGPDESPSIARDGTISFSNPRYQSSLLLHHLQSGVEREFLTDAWTLWGPSFSPDGNEVAVSRLDPDGSWRIWTVPLSGGSPRQLTSGAQPEVYPRYTADGSSIIYSTWSSGADRIWKILKTGGTAAAITPGRTEDDAYGDISPDGRRIAFARTEGDVTRIYVAPTEGGPEKMLMQSPATIPAWSPDGRWLAFSPNRSFIGGVFVIAADGSRERRIAETGGWPVWWPDGRRIGYITEGSDGNQKIQVFALDSGKTTTLSQLKFDGSNFAFDVSSKGELATTTRAHLNTQIWLLANKIDSGINSVTGH